MGFDIGQTQVQTLSLAFGNWGQPYMYVILHPREHSQSSSFTDSVFVNLLTSVCNPREWEPEAQEADTERGKEATLLNACFILVPSVLQLVLQERPDGDVPSCWVRLCEEKTNSGMALDTLLTESHRVLEPGGNFQTSLGPAAYLNSSSPTSPRQQSSKLSFQVLVSAEFLLQRRQTEVLIPAIPPLE
ncbi:uncharacterized protein [Ovis canadensis]|uniref:uncharacterized protein isoform X2 n=1 Tax=Ovis canadensis TaxID=37174 RepID=UPI0037538637